MLSVRLSIMRLLGDLLRARRAVAAVEFALMLPMLLVCLAGATDLSRAAITARKLTVAAQDVAMIASTMAVQTSTLGSLSGQQAWQATTAPFALFPQWLSAQSGPGAQPTVFAITLSGIGFSASGGGYTAATQWSVANPLGQVRWRPCGVLAAVANDGPVTLGSLPTKVFGPTSLLVADVSTVFTPVFTSVFIGNVPMSRSAFVSPRENNSVALSDTGSAPTEICSGGGS